MRLDDRINDNMNAFARYSFARFSKLGPSAFGEGGGPGVVDLGGNTKVKNQSLAIGLDWTLSSTSVLDMRFGWFALQRGRAAERLRHEPRPRRRHPGHERPERPVHLRPARRASSPAAPRDMGFGTGLGGGGLRESRCNCPLTQDEKQFQFVTNFTKSLGAHTAKFGIDIRRAYNLRVPSDEHRSGVIDFNAERTQGPTGGGLGLATFLLGRRVRLPPLRQLQHGRSRAAVALLRLRAGHLAREHQVDVQLRPARRGHHAADHQRGRQRRLLRRRHRRDAGGGRRRRRARRQHQEQDQPGAAPRHHLPAQREDRRPHGLRPQLRHRRVRLHLRPQRDPEPAGAGAPDPERARQLRARVHAGPGTAGAGLPASRTRTAASRRPTASTRRCCPSSSGCPTWTPTT